MNFIEATIHAVQQAVREALPRREIDQYWKRILPEALDFAANEVFLTLHRAHINGLAKQSAAQFAQKIPPREVDGLDDATLMVHYIMRCWLLRMSANRKYQAFVDQHAGVVYKTADPIVWVKPSFIWLPISDGIDRQIHRSLVERYKQFFFAKRCEGEIVRRLRQNEYKKHTFIQLSDSHGMRREQNEAKEWLCNASKRIAAGVGAQPEIGEDARQDWLVELLSLPLHIQVQKVGVTPIEIKHRAFDMQYRKGGKYEHVHFDDYLTETMPDQLTKVPSERMIAEEFPQRLLACQPQIEEILSEGRPEKGRRRFQVLKLMLTQKHQKNIAKRLNEKAPTITRDKKTIKQSWEQIQEVLWR